MDTGAPKRWHTREDSGLRLDRQLRWWHDDELIDHPRIVEAFNRGLKPTGDGRYRLEFGWDHCFVEVEDAAYGVTAIEVQGDAVALHLSDRTVEPLRPDTLTADADGALVCAVKEGRARARFSRDAQFELGGHVVEDEGRLCLVLDRVNLPLPSLSG